MNRLASINADLALATIVERMEFSTDMRTGECSLVISMLDDDRHPSTRIVIDAQDVSAWTTQGFGGGIAQLLCLRARDVSALQHDRLQFVLEDLEDRALSLECKELSITVTRVYVDK